MLYWRIGAARSFSAVATVSCAQTGDDESVAASEQPATEEPTRRPGGRGIDRPETQAKATLAPEAVDFGVQLAGDSVSESVTIVSGGDTERVITQIDLVAPNAGEPLSAGFALNCEALSGGAAPTSDAPLRIAPGDSATVQIVFTPSRTGTTEEDGSPLLRQARLQLHSNAGAASSGLLTGVGAANAKPIAKGFIAELAEGDIPPETTLHLSADESVSASGPIVAWQWEVDQPAGSHSVFQPSSAASNTTFQVNVAGEYTFRLRVWDDQGNESEFAWEQTIELALPPGIAVELLWHTPGDPDPTDVGPEQGSDMDLHFVHESLASGTFDIDGDGENDPWFAIPFDCFFFNGFPNGGDADPAVADDPFILRDDTDGAGPEIIHLEAPENTTYRVGVYYTDDNDFGESVATVRIFLDGQLVYEATSGPMLHWDLWEVAQIDWTTGEVNPIVGNTPGSPHILSNYIHPYFHELR